MKTMYDYAMEYQDRNKEKGTVFLKNDYSFEFVLDSKKDTDKVKSYTVMLSYFWELKMH